MSIFICEKCGCLDNTACSNNYWHASGNKYARQEGTDIHVSYKPEFSYFEDHICCSDCCNGLEYKDGSGVIKKGRFDEEEKTHWSSIGKEKLLEMEDRRNGSMINAREYLRGIGEL